MTDPAKDVIRILVTVPGRVNPATPVSKGSRIPSAPRSLSFRPKGGICFSFVIPTEGRNLLSSTLSATEKAGSLHVSSTAGQADTVLHLSTVFRKPNRTPCDEQPLLTKTASAHSHCARESETEQQRDRGFRPTNF